MSAGDVEALTTEARQLLAGQGEAALRGAALAAEATELGGAEAAHLMAVLAGLGAGRPQSWSDALDYLQLAAERGYEPAQGQLSLLAGASGPWKTLREAIDIEAWIAPPGRQVLSDAPRVRTVPGFASPAECAWLIERARAHLGRAQTYDLSQARSREDQARTNSAAEFALPQMDLILVLVRARMGRVMSLPSEVMELTAVLHYRPGEAFAPHFDFLDPDIEAFAQEIDRVGQRIATFLIYLNEGYEGGETDFPRAGLRYKGGQGDALYFANVDGSGGPDRSTLHAGLPPTSGEKWLLSQWVRDRSAG